MGIVLRFPRHAHASAGHRSGLSSERGTPVACSMGSTNSAGTPRLDLVSQYETICCLVPMRSAKGFCPPATSQARRKASLDMREPYSNFGINQPKNLSDTPNLNFGMGSTMREVDSAAFGRRVRSRRTELGMSQTELGKEAGHSQQNIDHIEKGKAKKPARVATEIAEALQTTREWLLWEEGPREFGPQYLSTQKLVEKYKSFPPNLKAAVSQFIEESARPKRPKRRSG